MSKINRTRANKVLDFPSTNLSRELAERYGYDEFIIRRWLGLFGEETLELIEAMENIPKYIRVNTLKIEEEKLLKRMEDRNFELRKTDVPYCYEIVREPYSAGSTPEYLMGYYYIMDKSSCIPPLTLFEEADASKGSVVIADFAASPGGKTTMLSQLLKEKGVKGSVLAIEAQEDRLQPLIDNIHRMGVSNVAVLHLDSRGFHRFGYRVDFVLLDAPCSGEGIIHKDESRKRSRGKEDIEFCSLLQRELLESAIKSVKSRGVVVYSTCSLTPEENEFVIQWAIENLPVDVEEINLPGRRGLRKAGAFKFDERMKHTKRYYPHTDRCSGFFVAKLRVL